MKEATVIIEQYANPRRFIRISDRLIPLFAALTGLCFIIGLYFALFDSPPDYQQKETVRIMYIHVPAAWAALFCYFFMGICSGIELVRRHHLAGLFAKATAPIGATFAFICLVTGSLWGKPTWGTWWIWDARLTSLLVLFFLYLGYMAVHIFSERRDKAAKIAGILCLVGLIDLPIIKFSVDWWNTLHQGASVLRVGGPSIHASMLTPLLIMAAGCKFLWLWLSFIGVRSELDSVRIDRLLRAKIKRSE